MLEPISVSLGSLNLITLSPMLIAIGGALLILLIDLFKEDLDKTLYVMLTMLILFVDIGATYGLNINERGFFDMMLVDGLLCDLTVDHSDGIDPFHPLGIDRIQ